MNETKLLVDCIMRDARALPLAKRIDPEALARTVYETCRTYARDVGMKPDMECAFAEPRRQGHIPAANGWTVVFEAGPHDWAIDASMELISLTGVTVEPYYGFDLTFYRA